MPVARMRSVRTRTAFELVSITRPEDSEAEHERMTRAAETVLQRKLKPLLESYDYIVIDTPPHADSAASPRVMPSIRATVSHAAAVPR